MDDGNDIMVSYYRCHNMIAKLLSKVHYSISEKKAAPM